MNEMDGSKVKEWKVRQVLKKDLGMSYRRLTSISVATNTVQNLILRQRYAL